MMTALASLALFLASPELTQAQGAWKRAWDDKPSLVTLTELGALDGTASEVEAQLRAHLRNLSRKTFSNREWRAYWLSQQETAEAFAAALRGASRAQAAAALDEWSKLAQAKVSNQDVYLAAIEVERDAVERRLESAMSATAEALTAKPDSSLDLGPFQQRQVLIERLKHDLRSQERRVVRAQQELGLVERQKQSAKQLLEALEKDAALAQTEASIAVRESQRAEASWAALWSPIARASAQKAQKIAQEERKGLNRIRSLDIESTLAVSQMAYRDAKIVDLKAQIRSTSSLEGWTDAIVASVTIWLTESLWKVLLALLGIWLLLKLALRMIGRLAEALRHVADDGDDDHLSQAEQRAGTIAAVFGGIAKVGAYAVAALTALEVIGINTGPIVGSVAILGLAVSFGSQNLVKDVVNGFFILIENQYAVGDVVTIGGNTGTVEKINLRSTRIRQYDGTLHVVPNGSIDSVANQTRDWARVVLTVGVAYESNLGMVEEVINTVGQGLYDDPDYEGQLDEPPLYVGVIELADSSVNVRCIVRTTPGAQWAVSRELQRRIKDAFDEAGIEIPFPQRVMRTA